VTRSTTAGIWRPRTLAIAGKPGIEANAGIGVRYATLAEIGERAAIGYFTPSLTSPWLRRIISFVRRFG
jgi:hypothetical protein